jgi:hypothetical protein
MLTRRLASSRSGGSTSNSDTSCLCMVPSTRSVEIALSMQIMSLRSLLETDEGSLVP